MRVGASGHRKVTVVRINRCPLCIKRVNFSENTWSERFVEKNGTVRYVRVSEEPGAPNENMVQNHLNKALLNVF